MSEIINNKITHMHIVVYLIIFCFSIAVGQYSTEVVVRDCMPASGNGCEKPSDSQKNILNGVLKFLTGINIDDLRVCTCNTDECDAICGNDSVRIGPYW